MKIGIDSHKEEVDHGQKGSVAGGAFSHAEGGATRAEGKAAHAEGMLTRASGNDSHAEGSGTLAGGTSSHAEGWSTTASGDQGSHAEGVGTTASGDNGSHAEGIDTTAIGESSHSEGTGSISSGDSAHSEGFLTMAGGRASHSEGGRTEAAGQFSHAEGSCCVANGNNAHAEGFQTLADNANSHTEGQGSIALGEASHAEGHQTRAVGPAAHAEGVCSTASGTGAHTEGMETEAVGPAAHTEGLSTVAVGIASHAEGMETKATGDCSHAEGNATGTKGHKGAHIMGKFGEATADYGWFMANGSDNTNKNISARILNSGDACFSSAAAESSSSCSHLAGMFETVDGRRIDPGFFVALVGDKIRRANSSDDYILGVTSASPALLVGSAELRWKGKYLVDEWGRPKCYDMITPTVTDKEGKLIKLAKIEQQPKISPEWNRKKKYVPRSLRPEWIAVGLIGQILLRDDGTCQVDGCCRPNDEGVAAASANGYRVLKRTGPNQIIILFR